MTFKTTPGQQMVSPYVCMAIPPLRAHLQSPYRGGHLSDAEKAFNSSMSAVRVAVEWGFNDISSYFSFLDFKKNLKMGLSPVGKMYSTCAVML